MLSVCGDLLLAAKKTLIGKKKMCRHKWIQVRKTETYEYKNIKYKCNKCGMSKEHSHVFTSDREECDYYDHNGNYLKKIKIWPTDKEEKERTKYAKKCGWWNDLFGPAKKIFK